MSGLRRRLLTVAAAVGAAALTAAAMSATSATAQPKEEPDTKIVSQYAADLRASTITATCPEGYRATGGGYWISDTRMPVAGNWPTDDGMGWNLQGGRFDFAVRGYVYAACLQDW